MSRLLEMKNIIKEFPGVMALDHVDFKLEEREIHALMGENGAGKSTLIKVLTGVYIKDSGEITMEGTRIQPTSPLQAKEHKISTVYQEVNLCPNLSVAENIMIGSDELSAKWVKWEQINKRAEELLANLNIQIDVKKRLDEYSIGIQQMAAIARALNTDAKILILDEPTASLDQDEVDQLFKVMRKLKSEGLGIIFVTHFLDQVYEVCDKVTVLRNGKFIGEYEIEALPKVELVAKMIGKDIEDFEKEGENKREEKPFLTGRGIGKKGKVAAVDVELFKGEVLGFGGLLGAGRTETARLLFGADQVDQGHFVMDGKKVQLKSPGMAVRKKIAFCPEDRKKEGIIGPLSVRENMILALQAGLGWGKFLPMKQQKDFVKKYIELLNIKTPHMEQPVNKLSGGNQQKVILGRWLLTNPELLILDEPTRGIDVGTKMEIQKLILKLAKENMSILFISSEIDEMLRCCHRMMIFKDHHYVGELEEQDMSANKMMKVIAGGDEV